MLSGTCLLCFTVNRRTFNIINTHLQPVLEKIINSKIHNASTYGLCFICHTRLEQSYQLWQLAEQTQCLLHNYLKDKVSDKIEPKKSLVELSVTKVIIISISSEGHVVVKQEPEVKKESSNEDDLVNQKDIIDVFTSGGEEEKDSPNMSWDSKDNDLLNVICTKEETHVTETGNEYRIEERLEDNKGLERGDLQNNVEDFARVEGDASVKLSVDDIGAGGICSKKDIHNLNIQDNDNMHLKNLKVLRVVIKKLDFIFTTNKNISHYLHNDSKTSNKSCGTQHLNDKSFNIDNNKMKSSECTLKDRIGTYTGDKSFTCDICHRKYSHEHSLKIHLRTHTGEKPFSCNICRREFSEKGTLKKHIKTHTGEKPFSCNICQHKFSVRGALKRHIKTHTGEKPFNCNICQYKFSEKHHLKTHLRTHTGEKPFSCNICQHKFTQKGTLINHIRTHTGEKPYTCNICNRKYSTKKILKIHIRRHTGENPFSCDICHRKFSDKSSLKIYIRRHIGEKPYTCNICNRKFSQTSSLNIHVRNHTWKSV